LRRFFFLSDLFDFFRIFWKYLFNLHFSQISVCKENILVNTMKIL